MSSRGDVTNLLTDKESVVVDPNLGGKRGESVMVGYNYCLVGRLCAPKPPNSFHLMEIMKKVWRAKKDITAREWGNKLFLFTFKNREDRDWVLNQQPWHFENYLFAVAALKGNEQPSSVEVNTCSFWVRAYDLPWNCMSSQNMIAIAQRMGTFEEIDMNENYAGSFMRFKVMVDINEPLLRGIMLKTEDGKVWIPLKYESLPIYCFGCGIIGHQTKNCDRIIKAEGESFDDLQYGPWIKASPLKKVRILSADSSNKNPNPSRTLFKPNMPTTNPIPAKPKPVMINQPMPITPNFSHKGQNIHMDVYRPPHLRTTLHFSPSPHTSNSAQQMAPVVNLTLSHPFHPNRPTILDPFPEPITKNSIMPRLFSKKPANLVDIADTANEVECNSKKRDQPEPISFDPNECELDKVYKKLKSTELFTFPSDAVFSAGIAKEQSRRSK